METEKLKFKIGLSGTSPDKQPHFLIDIDGKNQIKAALTKAPNETEYFEFEIELDEGNHCLDIRFTNKISGDTVLDEKGHFLSDLLLNIDSIEIDEIDLGTLKWTLSEYRPQYHPNYVNEYVKSKGKEPEEIVKNCVNMGWNGTWTLPFQSPFYIWLLENL
jgi:hypothetical protein